MEIDTYVSYTNSYGKNSLFSSNIFIFSMPTWFFGFSHYMKLTTNTFSLIDHTMCLLLSKIGMVNLKILFETNLLNCIIKFIDKYLIMNYWISYAKDPIHIVKLGVIIAYVWLLWSTDFQFLCPSVCCATELYLWKLASPNMFINFSVPWLRCV